MVGRRIEDPRYKRCLEGRGQDAVEGRKEHRSSKSPSPRIFFGVSDEKNRRVEINCTPVRWHLFESHLEENLSELMAYLVH